jgi:RNA polymerase sigma-70 factor (ECF subfamily)
MTVTSALLDEARSGDEEAFRQLVDPYWRELQVHAYRILGSVQDAEDALQDTMLSAWQSLGGFEGRSSLRTWLYQITTHRCLNALRSARRRPQTDWPPPGLSLPEPTRLGEVTWLEPYPDMLLEGLPDRAPGPAARFEATEAISLAFIVAVQALPPRQRAVLILRDVLGYPAREVARMLDSTEESVTSALKRARATVARHFPAGRHQAPPPDSPAERRLVERLTHAYETGRVEDLVALLADDVLLTMPPIPLEYVGRDMVARFLAAVVFPAGNRFRLVPVRANGQPAFGMYLRTPGSEQAEGNGIMVFTLAGGTVSAMARFGTAVLPRFGLPAALPVTGSR